MRAIAPVAGNPPKSGETMLATPWAINSTFGLCLSLLMRSETTADISDSIAPSMATVNAGRQQLAQRRCSAIAGIANVGRPLGIPPKRVPMVSTGTCSRVTAMVAPKSDDDRAREFASRISSR